MSQAKGESVLFPQKMFRLVWFLPHQRLASSLERLAETGVFHLADRCLGESDSHELEAHLQAFVAQQRYRRSLLARRYRQAFPEQTLLDYQFGEYDDPGCLPEGTLGNADGLFLCCATDGSQFAGAQETPFFSRDCADLRPDTAVEISDAQWRLLLERASQIGVVGRWAIIDGWIPAHALNRFRRLQGEEALLLVPAEACGVPWSQVPSLFRRPRALDGFAAMMGLYGTAGYRQLDPAPLLAVGFTLMFGMMFADLGQGLLLFLLGYWLSSRWFPWGDPELLWRVGSVLMPVGLSAAFFGAMFGSVFAREDWIPALYHYPLAEVVISFSVSVGIGAGMLCAGMLFSLINAFWRGQLSALRWDNFGPLGLAFYLGLIIFACAALGGWDGMRYSGALLAVGALGVMAVHYFAAAESEPLGIRLLLCAVESYDFVIRFVVQTLSFVRIAAFTFAHIALSSALMIIVELLAGWPWLAWSTFALGNLLITLLEGLLVSIQVIRLHFFEFFTKFVAGEGIPFRPLAVPERREYANASVG